MNIANNSIIKLALFWIKKCSDCAKRSSRQAVQVYGLFLNVLVVAFYFKYKWISIFCRCILYKKEAFALRYYNVINPTFSELTYLLWFFEYINTNLIFLTLLKFYNISQIKKYSILFFVESKTREYKQKLL